MRTRSMRHSALSCVLVVVISVCARAAMDSVEVNVTQGLYLLNADSADARLLLRIPIPGELSEVEILFAELFVPMRAHMFDSSALRVSVHPLTVSWDEDTSWEDLGDYLSRDVISGEGTDFATSLQGFQEANFDVADIVMAWRENSLSNNGLILFCSSHDQSNFRCEYNPKKAIARMRFFYRR